MKCNYLLCRTVHSSLSLVSFLLGDGYAEPALVCHSSGVVNLENSPICSSMQVHVQCRGGLCLCWVFLTGNHPLLTGRFRFVVVVAFSQTHPDPS